VDVDGWSNLVQNRKYFRGFVNTLINIGVTKKARNFLSKWIRIFKTK
jgi:hypothetical protein